MRESEPAGAPLECPCAEQASQLTWCPGGPCWQGLRKTINEGERLAMECQVCQFTTGLIQDHTPVGINANIHTITYALFTSQGVGDTEGEADEEQGMG